MQPQDRVTPLRSLVDLTLIVFPQSQRQSHTARLSTMSCRLWTNRRPYRCPRRSSKATISVIHKSHAFVRRPAQTTRRATHYLVSLFRAKKSVGWKFIFQWDRNRCHGLVRAIRMSDHATLSPLCPQSMKRPTNCAFVWMGGVTEQRKIFMLQKRPVPESDIFNGIKISKRVKSN